MGYLSEKEMNKARDALTVKLPPNDREFLRREEACLEACAFVASYGSLHQAWKVALTAQHAIWMDWLVCQVGLTAIRWQRMTTTEEASQACDERRATFKWRTIAARMARRNAVAKKGRRR